MDGFDLRFVIPIIINILKFHSGGLPLDWNAFNIIVSHPNKTSWTKISFHVSLFLLFSSTSITFTLARPWPDTALIRFRFGNFSPHIAVSLACSLVFPQALFWFLYPVILILSRFLGWVNVKLSALPVWNLHISSTLTHHEESNIHTMESQVPVPQVTIAISPEDDDSLAEG